MPIAEPKTTKGRLRTGGRVVVPAAFRAALGLKENEALFARIENGEIHLLMAAAAVRRAQAMVRGFVPEGVSLVDELIEERRCGTRRRKRRG